MMEPQTTTTTAASIAPSDAARALSRAMQDDVPFAPRPFAALGAPLGLDEKTVLEQLHAWRDEGKLREISAVVEGEAVGYESALVAARVPPVQLESVAAAISAHPTVTHNYLRGHDFNLWFTFAVPGDLGLERALGWLAEEAGLAEYHPVRRTETYKIGVNFDLATLRNDTAAREIGPVAQVRLDAGEQAMVRALQTPLPLEGWPFSILADQAGVTEPNLLGFGQRHLGGLIRRYAGTLRHRKVGVRSNAMVVWNVPPDRREIVGRLLAGAPEVSHCYAREDFPGFPYSVYSMVHAADAQESEAAIQRLSKIVWVDDYRVLTSTREFKKVRMRYFLPELEAWRRHHEQQERRV